MGMLYRQPFISYAHKRILSRPSWPLVAPVQWGRLPPMIYTLLRHGFLLARFAAPPMPKCLRGEPDWKVPLGKALTQQALPAPDGRRLMAVHYLHPPYHRLHQVRLLYPVPLKYPPKHAKNTAMHIVQWPAVMPAPVFVGIKRQCPAI